MSQPGWYRDPGGQPGRCRFWDGRVWSAATTTDPRTPPPAAVPPPAPPAGTGPVAYAPGVLSARRRSAVPWLVRVIALAVVLVVVAVLVLRNLVDPTVAGPDPGPDPSTSTQVCPDAVLEAATPPAQTGNRRTASS